ncbi:MAG TPA: hypothetical protein VMZ53_03610 [Kofleriaceae bacterium]|nr:hypothetical protein [Kofleriaceae bacterium]
MAQRLKAKAEAITVRKALGRSPLARPAFTEPAPPLELTIETTDAQRLADAEVALEQPKIARHMLEDARTRLAAAGAGGPHPAAIAVARSLAETYKAIVGARLVVRTVKR